MEHYIARQAVYDRQRQVFGYELLFRRGLEDYFDAPDSDQESSQVILNSFLLFGIDELTEGKNAFLRATRNILVSNALTALPRHKAVIELLDEIGPDSEVLAACHRLKSHGYKLVLGDFACRPDFRLLLPLADLVKIDFSSGDLRRRRELADLIALHNVGMVAEGVDTELNLEEALELGCNYFQGSFFSLPMIVSRRDIPASKINLLRIMGLVNDPEMEIEELASLIVEDVAITYNLLKIINSVIFNIPNRISSVQQALVLLGATQIRKWISLLALAEIATDKPAELVVSSLKRGRTAELLSPHLGLAKRSPELFLLGLFSLLDAVMGRPMDELINTIPLKDDVKEAILGRPGLFKGILGLCVALERGDWDECDRIGARLGLNAQEVVQANTEAWQWTREALRG